MIKIYLHDATIFKKHYAGNEIFITSKTSIHEREDDPRESIKTRRKEEKDRFFPSVTYWS